jgi:hypothetical protein
MANDRSGKPKGKGRSARTSRSAAKSKRPTRRKTTLKRARKSRGAIARKSKGRPNGRKGAASRKSSKARTAKKQRQRPRKVGSGRRTASATSDAPPGLVATLLLLGGDPDEKRRFQEDPEGFMESRGLREHEKRALRAAARGEFEALEAQLGRIIGLPGVEPRQKWNPTLVFW